MGMAASQIRFLQLTRRNNFIGCQLASYSLQKTALAREMDKVSVEYNDRLSHKVLRMSNNSGLSYVDLTYDTLMRPSQVNNSKPYILTDRDGKVVLDSKYLNYAKLISPDGNAGGDWKTNRSQILEELTGVPKAKLDESNVNSEAVQKAQDKIDALKQKGAKYKEPVDTDNNAYDFLDKAGIVTLNNQNYDLVSLFKAGSKVNLGSAETAKAALQTLFKSMADNLKPYLREEDLECFNKACAVYMNTYEEYFGGKSETIKQGLNNDEIGIYERKGSYSVNMKTLLSKILESYAAESMNSPSPAVHTSPFDSSEFYFDTRNMSSTEWNTWNDKVNQLEEDLKAAYEELDTALDKDSTLLTAEEEAKIEFYDQIFEAIAEKGWIYNDQVDNKEYINNMLQNNLYFLTTVEKQKKSETGKEINVYTDNLAQNFNNIVKFQDVDNDNEALVDIEQKKKRINAKETRIDLAMKNLEAEKEANETMKKSIKNVMKDNIDRTYVTSA